MLILSNFKVSETLAPSNFIYIADALTDLSDDVKKGRYNPLVGEDSLEKAKRNLYFCINEAIAAFELIDIKQYKQNHSVRVFH